MNALLKKTLEFGGTLGTAAVLTRAILRSIRWFSYDGKVALITGGSRGLGLELARQLVAAGSRVAICARDEQELQAAEADLEGRGGDVLAVVCDVRKQDEVDAMVKQVEDRFGRLDVSINNAGVIEVGPLDSMTLDDFREAMETHFWGPLYTTLAALPGMRRRRWGRIVNIASIGGKQAVPHLIPYSASKFALVGLSKGLRAELAKDGILVTTICPSLMKTGSPRNATFKGQHRREYAWFAISDSLPLVSIDSSKAAARILRACQRGDAETMIGGSATLMRLASIADAELTELLSLINRFLPGMGGIGQARAKGFESESAVAPSILTRATDRAAMRNNEVR